MSVPILKQGNYLIASLQASLSDKGWEQLRDELLERIGRFRTAGVVIDVSEMDVMDSYATRSLDGIGTMASLRGAQTVVVGIQPGVAFAMAQLGLKLANTGTALDLDAGLAVLEQLLSRARHGG
jgi:rsbT antagonist protein RsbS